MDRRARLQTARLYLIASDRPGGRPLADVLGPALEGGVDLFQLRAKAAPDEAVLAAAAVARDLCAAAGALFFVNDRPDLAAAADADGVHVGQDDMPVGRAREIVGAGRLVGLSTHTPADIDAADADLIGVGPVHATPTKAGRPAVGLELVRYAAAHARMPWFAIGGIDEGNVAAVLGAGATRVSVVRAIAEAADPRGAAHRLRETLETRREPANAA
ncbi:MAG: thiamine phosphate synthase [Solirubrobacteraceae bacterium]